jgi:hypothetical protein
MIPPFLIPTNVAGARFIPVDPGLCNTAPKKIESSGRVTPVYVGPMTLSTRPPDPKLGPVNEM